jgi:hypothetical protein
MHSTAQPYSTPLHLQAPFTVDKVCPSAAQPINTQFEFTVTVKAPSNLPDGIKVVDLLPSNALTFSNWDPAAKYSINGANPTGAVMQSGNATW